MDNIKPRRYTNIKITYLFQDEASLSFSVIIAKSIWIIISLTYSAPLLGTQQPLMEAKVSTPPPPPPPVNISAIPVVPVEWIYIAAIAAIAAVVAVYRKIA